MTGIGKSLKISNGQRKLQEGFDRTPTGLKKSIRKGRAEFVVKMMHNKDLYNGNEKSRRCRRKNESQRNLRRLPEIKEQWITNAVSQALLNTSFDWMVLARYVLATENRDSVSMLQWLLTNTALFSDVRLLGPGSKATG